MLQKLIYYIFVFCLQTFLFCTFLFLELFLDEHAMVLRYTTNLVYLLNQNNQSESQDDCR